MSGGAVDRIVARASSRETVRPGDARTGSHFERVVVDGERCFLKRLSRRSDWVMRVTGDRVHRPYVVWRAGIMARSSGWVDHAVIEMQRTGRGDAAELSILMRDVSPHLVPEGDAPVPPEHHARFMDGMAALAASWWGFEGPPGLTSMAERARFFAPATIAPELAREPVPGPVAAAQAGWRALAERSPLLASVARAVHERPELVTDRLAATPQTFVHGDWKMGNLGVHPDGRTILLDWAYPGAGPACWDLAWYLALNRARLPEPKEAAVERFRAALERHGIATEPWWTAQLDLCLAGIMATFGWEKALGDEAELRWWEARVAEAVRRRRLPVAVAAP